jgi:hypothetical protein
LIFQGDYTRDGLVNATQQMICFKSVFDTFLNEPWWQGVYWWAWLTDPNSGIKNPKDYTPQQKSAQTLLKTFYK